jgi:BirA family biotin operon repressor/biotin-[acetyl-CoA-carboxylase] ligase
MKLLAFKNPFNAPVYHEETLSSTFDIARMLAAQGEPHGTVITADFQEAGRGRLNRPWSSEKGKNLLFTILFRFDNFSSAPEENPAFQARRSMPKALTLRTGLAVSLALEDTVPALTGQVLIKWPNDIMIGFRNSARKAAGILTEGDGIVMYIGVGVNVFQADFQAEYSLKAGSLIQLSPDLHKDTKFFLLERILFRLHEEIENPEKAGFWHERLSERLYKKGETVTFAEGFERQNSPAGSARLVEGVLSGIGQDGELLLLEAGKGRERAFVTGELRVY